MIVRAGAGLVQAMRRTAGLALAPLLLFALAGCSDAPGKEAAGPPPNPLLYEIASADGAVEGWMLGTIHALPPGTNWQNPAIEQAADAADLLVVEIAALDDREALTGAFAALGTTPGLPPLDRRLPASLRPALADLLDRGGMDPGRFTTTESWAAALMLAQVDAEGDPDYGVDRALIRRFGPARVRELEGVRGQLAIFDALPEADQRALIAAVVRDAERQPDRASELRRAWLAGDETALVDAATTGLMADPALRAALLTDRNARWVDAIDAMLGETARPLVAVGTAHLVGPDGLAALLTARGYRVRRLGPDTAPANRVANPPRSL